MSRKTLIIIVSVAAAGLAAIFWFVNSRAGTGSFTAAMDHLSGVSSYSAGIALDFMYGPAGAEQGGAIPMRLSGPSQVGRLEGDRFVIAADLDVSAGTPSTKIMSLSARLPEDGNLYAMIEGLPDEVGAIIDIEGLNGTWFTLGNDALAMLLPWAVSGSQADVGAAARSDAPFLRPGRRHADTILEGIPVAHYQAIVDKGALVSALVGLGRSLRDGGAADASSVAEYVAGKSFLAEAWIDKRTDRFYLIKIIAVPTDSEEGEPVAVTVKFTDFDSEVTVEAPEGARPLSSVLGKLLLMPASSVGESR
jgi:hypothetical protein